MKRFVQQHLFAYRVVLLLLPTPLLFSDVGVEFLGAFFLYVLAGLVVRFVENKGARSSSELGLYSYYCFALHFVEYLWNGFDKGNFVDD